MLSHSLRLTKTGTLAFRGEKVSNIRGFINRFLMKEAPDLGGSRSAPNEAGAVCKCELEGNGCAPCTCTNMLFSMSTPNGVWITCWCRYSFQDILILKASIWSVKLFVHSFPSVRVALSHHFSLHHFLLVVPNIRSEDKYSAWVSKGCCKHF